MEVAINREIQQARRYQAGPMAMIVEGKNVRIIGLPAIGKTWIVFGGLYHFFQKLTEDQAVLFLAPTHFIVRQHYRNACRTLELPKGIIEVTGELSPKKRPDLYQMANLIIATPEVVANDLDRRVLPLDRFRLIVFDEGLYGLHNPESEIGYAYCRIAEAAAKLGIQRVALAPTVGRRSTSHRFDRLTFPITEAHRPVRLPPDEEIMNNLHLSDGSYTVTKEELRGYLPPTVFETIATERAEELRPVIAGIEALIDQVIEELVGLGYLRKKKRTRPVDQLSESYRTGERLLPMWALRAISHEADRLIHEGTESGNSADVLTGKGGKLLFSLFQILRVAWQMSVNSEPAALLDYLKDQAPLPRDKVLESSYFDHPGSSKWIINQPTYRQIRRALDPLVEKKFMSAKTRTLGSLIYQALSRGERVLVFVNFVEDAVYLTELLNQKLQPRFNRQVARYCVGQGHERFGMKKKEQMVAIEAFSTNQIPVLIGTQHLEAGIDLDAHPIDLVINYGQPLNHVSLINRDGRTGRKVAGEVVDLFTDHPLSWSDYFSVQYRLREAESAPVQPPSLFDHDQLLIGQPRRSFYGQAAKQGGETDPWAEELPELFLAGRTPRSEKRKEVPIIGRFWTRGDCVSEMKGRLTIHFSIFDRTSGDRTALKVYIEGKIGQERIGYYQAITIGPVIVSGRLCRSDTGALYIAVDERSIRREYVVNCPEEDWDFRDYF